MFAAIAEDPLDAGNAKAVNNVTRQAEGNGLGNLEKLGLKRVLL